MDYLIKFRYGGPHIVQAEDYYNANITTNGFLSDGPTKAIQLAQNDNEIDPTSNVYVNRNNNDGKIKIKINKGSDAITIEL